MAPYAQARSVPRLPGVGIPCLQARNWVRGRGTLVPTPMRAAAPCWRWGTCGPRTLSRMAGDHPLLHLWVDPGFGPNSDSALTRPAPANGKASPGPARRVGPSPICVLLHPQSADRVLRMRHGPTQPSEMRDRAGFQFRGAPLIHLARPLVAPMPGAHRPVASRPRRWDGTEGRIAPADSSPRIPSVYRRTVHRPHFSPR